MRGLLLLIIRYHFFLLFLIFETFSLLLVFQFNAYQKAAFFSSSNYFTGKVYTAFDNFTSYLNLKNTNEQLANENARLRNSLNIYYSNNKISLKEVIDSVYIQQYTFFPARVINNSVNKQNNFLTLNKGRNHGVKKGMGVIAPKGVVGVVKEVSRNYCTVISVLNPVLKVSSKIQKNNYIGSLVWNSKNSREAQLQEIPYHVNLAKGDKIVTSGFSSIFPGGIEIGEIIDFDLPEGKNYYDITVLLSTEFEKLDYVYVISNLFKEERDNLEQKILTEND